MLVLKSPNYFDFDNTVRIIQRGEEDPINFLSSGRWIRCLSYFTSHVIVEVFEKNRILFIDILKGEVSEKDIKEEISKLLGFDDVFTKIKITNFNENKLVGVKEVQSIPLPRYSSLFETIVQTILGQQVSGTIANRVRSSFIRNFGKRINYRDRDYYIFPTPSEIQNIKIESIKKIGISSLKATSIKNSSEFFDSEKWVKRITSEDTQVETCSTLLKNIYGVGQWTADWFILRGLRRFFHVPASDLIVRKAVTWWFEKKELLSASEVNKFSQTMGPYKGLIVYKIMLCYMKRFIKNS